MPYFGIEVAGFKLGTTYRERTPEPALLAGFCVGGNRNGNIGGQDVMKQSVSLSAHASVDYFLEQSPVITYTCLPHRDFAVSFITNNVKDQLGYEPEEFLNDSSFWIDHIYPDDRERVLGDLAALLEKGSQLHEYRFLHADGHYRWVRAELHMVTDQAGKAQEIVGYWIDITDSVRVQQELAEHNAELSAILNSLVDGVITVNEHGIIESVNHATEILFGYFNGEAIGKNVGELMPNLYRDEHNADVEDNESSGANQVLGIGHKELDIRRKDGSVMPVDLVISEADIGGRSLFIVVVRDITKRIDEQESLIQQPNRISLCERLHQAIDWAERNERLVVLMYVGLDRVQLMHQHLGHEAANELLMLIKQRLTECVRNSDTVARLGGIAQLRNDEFALILEGIQHIDGVSTVVEKVIDTFQQSFTGAGYGYLTEASIGVGVYPFDHKSPDNLLMDAEDAMAYARKKGGHSFRFYSTQTRHQVQRRLELDIGLRRALERDEYVLHYQPQIDLLSGRLVGNEALVRWQSAAKGLVSPMDFIPVLEDTGLIVEVGRWVLREACRQNRIWHEAGFDHLTVSVNLSGKQFRDPKLMDNIRSILAETGLDPKLLSLEITESIIMEDTEAAIEILRHLYAIGIQLSIDDFGTGYSSLATLKRMSLHTLKIDRTFIKDIPDDHDGIAVTKAIIGLAAALNLNAIAEGVETRAQLQFMIDNGCAQMQGYYFSRPLPADDLLKLLQAGRHLSEEERTAPVQSA
ncbi:MAG: EAL domain-containing protein [Gammaproteobacteria bacterium]